MFRHSSVFVIDYGLQETGRVALGSLDLLSQQQAFDSAGMTGPFTAVHGVESVGGTGSVSADAAVALPDSSFDLVLMNPPFTRDTGHEAAKIGVPNPMFAAFKSSKDAQRAMAKAMDGLLKNTSYHGNAGEASAFLVLADRKVKQHGTIALVMPLRLMQGEAWEASRQLLKRLYGDLMCVSIAGARDEDLSFSADTGMAECLVIARKTGIGSDRATFVVLKEKPGSQIAGATIAREILRVLEASPRHLEDGPFGGTEVRFGVDPVGFALDCPLPSRGSWGVARVADASVAQAAFQLAVEGRVWLPGMGADAELQLPMCPLGGIGEIGPYHMDVNATTSTGGVRGPFEVRPVPKSVSPTYPVLWQHDAARERCIQFEAESEGLVRQGSSPVEVAAIIAKAERIYGTASHLHVNRDLRFNSQSTAMQFATTRTIGGRAWPSVRLSSAAAEKLMALWGNSTLGVLMHWWHANKQQAGRGQTGVTALASLPVVDVTALGPQALVEAELAFEELCGSPLLPINEIDRDPVRAQLDRRLLVDVLGLPATIADAEGPVALMRSKLALEPSIADGKRRKATE